MIIIMTVLLMSCSKEHSFTLWDNWEIRGRKDFKLTDFLNAVKVGYICI